MCPATAPPPPPPQLERVVFARSGTLLLTWTDVGSSGRGGGDSSSIDSSGGGGLLALRKRLRAAFPGASLRQPQTIHSSLLRVLTPRPLDEATVKALSEEAERWTQKVRLGRGVGARRWRWWGAREGAAPESRPHRRLSPLQTCPAGARAAAARGRAVALHRGGVQHDARRARGAAAAGRRRPWRPAQLRGRRVTAGQSPRAAPSRRGLGP
jgi:hypothetical protein